MSVEILHVTTYENTGNSNQTVSIGIRNVAADTGDPSPLDATFTVSSPFGADVIQQVFAPLSNQIATFNYTLPMGENGKGTIGLYTVRVEVDYPQRPDLAGEYVQNFVFASNYKDFPTFQASIKWDQDLGQVKAQDLTTWGTELIAREIELVGNPDYSTNTAKLWVPAEQGDTIQIRFTASAEREDVREYFTFKREHSVDKTYSKEIYANSLDCELIKKINCIREKLLKKYNGACMSGSDTKLLATLSLSFSTYLGLQMCGDDTTAQVVADDLEELIKTCPC